MNQILGVLEIKFEDGYYEKLDSDENNYDNNIDSVEPCPKDLLKIQMELMQ